MPKIINEPVNVYKDTNSRITAFIWRQRLYYVLDILSSWWEASDWWDGKPESFMVRVNATKGTAGIYELCKTGGQWFLHSLID